MDGISIIKQKLVWSLSHRFALHSFSPPHLDVKMLRRIQKPRHHTMIFEVVASCSNLVILAPYSGLHNSLIINIL